jgi:putative transposase
MNSKKNDIKISMDGKGRALDNIYIESFWRTIKYEHIYLYPANGGIELLRGMRKYIDFYNNERRHDSLNQIAPNNFYYSNVSVSYKHLNFGENLSSQLWVHYLCIL